MVGDAIGVTVSVEHDVFIVPWHAVQTAKVWNATQRVKVGEDVNEHARAIINEVVDRLPKKGRR